MDPFFLAVTPIATPFEMCLKNLCEEYSYILRNTTLAETFPITPLMTETPAKFAVALEQHAVHLSFNILSDFQGTLTVKLVILLTSMGLWVALIKATSVR